MANEREKTLRLFVACSIPDDVLRGLAAIQQDLRSAGFDRLRYVRPEGIHITLKFLGAVRADRVDAITRALAAAVEPFELRIQTDRIGSFGGQRVRVVWAGLTGNLEPLEALAAHVESALEPLGFPRENRAFAPHLTLARVPDDASPDERERLAAFVTAYQFPHVPPMIIMNVALIRSILGPGGSKYEHLVSFPSERG